MNVQKMPAANRHIGKSEEIAARRQIAMAVLALIAAPQALADASSDRIPAGGHRTGKRRHRRDGLVGVESGPETPVLAHFLPLHHIVLLHKSSVVMHLDEHAAAARPVRPILRNVNSISGPSGTTDIEGKLVPGAHGPCHLHVVPLDSHHQ